MEIAVAFAASRDGEMERLRALLRGAGRRTRQRHAAVRDVRVCLCRSRPRLVRYGFANGLPGFITIERGDVLQTTALEIGHGRIVGVTWCEIQTSSDTWRKGSVLI